MLAYLFGRALRFWNGVCVLMYQCITGTLLVTKERYCTLAYCLEGNVYYVVFPKRRGPCVIKGVTHLGKDGTRDDVTEEFKKYLGPGNNFYTIKTTPKMMGWHSLLVETMGGVKEFQTEEEIVI